MIASFITILFVLIAICETGDSNGKSHGKNMSTEFFRIKEETYEKTNGIRESFVISNPPKDTLMLKKIIEEYNCQTLSPNTIKRYTEYRRDFYIETRCLTRHYKEGKPYPEPGGGCLFCFDCETEYNGDDPGQQLRYHFYSKDLLMITDYSYFRQDSNTLGGYWVYSYRFRGVGYRDITFNDIVSFYVEHC